MKLDDSQTKNLEDAVDDRLIIQRASCVLEEWNENAANEREYVDEKR